MLFFNKKLRLNTNISSSLYELDQELPKGQMYQNDNDSCDTFTNFIDQWLIKMVH